MRDSQNMMVQKQGEKISELNQKLRKSHDAIRYYQRLLERYDYVYCQYVLDKKTENDRQDKHLCGEKHRDAVWVPQWENNAFIDFQNRLKELEQEHTYKAKAIEHHGKCDHVPEDWKASEFETSITFDLTSDVETQARVFENIVNNQMDKIKEKNSEILDLKTRIARLEKSGGLYMKIQETCKTNPPVLSAWKDFLMVAELSEDNVQEKWK